MYVSLTRLCVRVWLVSARVLMCLSSTSVSRLPQTQCAKQNRQFETNNEKMIRKNKVCQILFTYICIYMGGYMYYLGYIYYFIYIYMHTYICLYICLYKSACICA